MKKLIFLTVMLAASVAAYAQGQMVVSSEKIFKSMPLYVSTVESIDAQAAQYQRALDAAYTEIERLAEEYRREAPSLSDAARQQREQLIARREQQAEEYRESKFGQEGELIRKRIESIKPIQDRVFGIIADYARQHGYTAVLDIAANPGVIYYAPSIDKTSDIINLVK